MARETSTSQTHAEALVVREGESPWTAEELDDIREQLQSERTRLREELVSTEEEIAALLRDGGDGAGNDQADIGATSLERDAEMSLVHNAREMLFQVEHALARTADGTYGVCESCGNPVGKDRLLAFPRATLCVTCKQREERR
jgi:DnaK suppressor protein